jgi:hypothetical protein
VVVELGEPKVLEGERFEPLGGLVRAGTAGANFFEQRAQVARVHVLGFQQLTGQLDEL